MNMNRLQTKNLAVYALYICTKVHCHPNASLPKSKQKQS